MRAFIDLKPERLQGTQRAHLVHTSHQPQRNVMPIVVVDHLQIDGIFPSEQLRQLSRRHILVAVEADAVRGVVGGQAVEQVVAGKYFGRCPALRWLQRECVGRKRIALGFERDFAEGCVPKVDRLR